MVEYFTVGYILKPQGIEGEVKVEPLTDDMTRFDKLETILLKRDNSYKSVAIEQTRYMGNYVVLKFAGCDDRSSAEKFRNQYLWIPRSMARELPKDTYFISDIIGCTVYTNTGKELGSVIDVIYTGSNDVYIINSKHGEILIPALKKVVREVDIKNKFIKIDTTEVEGLIPYEI